MRITPELQLIGIDPFVSAASMPQVTVRFRRQPRPTAMLVLNKHLRTALGIDENSGPTHVQIYCSTTALQIRKCREDTTGSRSMNRDGRVRIDELIKLFDMSDGDEWVLVAEVADSESPRSTRNAIATLPEPLRKRIAKIHGEV